MMPAAEFLEVLRELDAGLQISAVFSPSSAAQTLGGSSHLLVRLIARTLSADSSAARRRTLTELRDAWPAEHRDWWRQAEELLQRGAGATAQLLELVREQQRILASENASAPLANDLSANVSQLANREAEYQRLIRLPADHPDRLEKAWMLHFRSSLRGEAMRLSPRERRVRPEGPRAEIDLLQTRLFQGVESGDLELAASVREPLERLIANEEPWVQSHCRWYLSLHWLLEQIQGRQPISRPLALQRAQAIGGVMRTPMATHLEQTFVRLLELRDLGMDRIQLSPLESTWDSHDLLSPGAMIATAPIRFALSRRSLTEAEVLLEARRQGNFRSCIDNWFWARLELLNGRTTQAATHLALATEEAQRLDMMPRLGLEMALDPDPEFARFLASSSRRPASSIVPAEAPADAASTGAPSELVGVSPAIQRIREQIMMVAKRSVPVLVTGESGTGKEILCRAIHHASSRGHLPLVVMNCASLGDSLVESDLFGHLRGAFSGAERDRPGLVKEAASGTLVLDEIGDASPRFQASLLRLIELGEFRPIGSDRIEQARCRFIAATNADLSALVASGRFRADLYHRLSAFRFHIPPLRERPEDIPVLAEHLIQQGPEPRPRLGRELLQRLMAYDWPGNVRELRNVIERLSAGSDSGLPAGSSAPRPATDRIRRSRSSHAPAVRGDALTRSILSLATERGRLNRRSVVDALGIPARTATLHLSRLVDAGKLRHQRPSPAPQTHYYEAIGVS